MRLTIVALMCAAGAIGQTPEQTWTFTFARLSGAQGLQDLANTIRSVGQLRTVLVDTELRTVTVRCSEPQLAMVAWLTTEADRAPDDLSGPFRREFSLAAGDRWPAVRVFHPARIRTPLELQDAVNAIRSIAETPMVTVMTAPPLIALRGSVEQATAAEWIVGALDEESPPAMREHRMPGVYDGIIRAFVVRPDTTADEYQAMFSQIRKGLIVQRVAVCPAARTIVVRGTENQVAAVEKFLR